MKILVIGESCKDVYQYGKSYRLAPEAPVPVFQPYKTIVNGGMAMNVYNNVKSLGIPVDIITNTNWEEIEKERFVDEKTNQMFLRVDKNDETYGVCDDTLLEGIDKYDAIIISDYDKGFLPKDKISKICKLHPKVFLDTKKILGYWAENSKFIKINNYEYKASLNYITTNLIKKLIITLGEKGCEYLGKNYGVPTVEVKDLCGAGDTFIACLVTHYLKTSSIEESIIFANEGSTHIVQKRGVGVIKKYKNG